MNVFDSRLESFKARRVPKNPSSKLNSSSGTTLVKWPHPSTFKATPMTLADAGFVYAPSVVFKDNVVCFFCGKELNDWGQDDDPAEVHFDKCGDTCSWASVKCGLSRDFDNRQQFIATDPSRLPSGKVLEKCRLDTFSAWPHDASKGHGANSKRMAKAGFVYTPQAQDDDSASCIYCGIILNGWEPDDDPMEEHRKRDRKAGTTCTFFITKASMLGRSISKKRSKSSSRPNARSRSTRPKMTTTETEQSSDTEVDILRMSTRSTRSTRPRFEVVKATTSTPSLRSSATKRQVAAKVSEVEEQSDSEVGKGQKSNTRRAKGKGKIGTITEEDETIQVNGKEEGLLRKSKRGKGKVKESLKEPKTEIPSEEPRERTRQTRRQTRSRSKAMPESGPDGDSLAAIFSDSLDGSDPPKKASRLRSTRKPRLVESESEDGWQSALEGAEPERLETPTKISQKKLDSRSGPVKKSAETMTKPSGGEEQEQRLKSSKKYGSKTTPFHDKASNQRVYSDPKLRVGSHNASRSSVGSKENLTALSKEWDSEFHVHRAIIDISDDAEDTPTNNPVPLNNTPTTVVLASAETGGSMTKIVGKTMRFDVSERLAPRRMLEEPQEEKNNSDDNAVMEVTVNGRKHPDPISHSEDHNDGEESQSSKHASARMPQEAKPASGKSTIHLDPAMDIVEDLPSSIPRMEQANPFLLLEREQDNPLLAFQVPYGKVPMKTLFTLTEVEKDMTIEEWTKRELEVQLEKFRRDGYRRIEEFKDRAAEVRRQIEAL